MSVGDANSAKCVRKVAMWLRFVPLFVKYNDHGQVVALHWK